MLVRAPRELGELTECLRALQKQEYNCSMITFRSAKRIRVYANRTMDWTLDGEWEPGHAEVEVENLHTAVQILRNEAKA